MSLKGLSAKITFEPEGPSREIPIEITSASELENVRQLQTRINEIITEKICELKAENKLAEVPEIEDDEEEPATDEE